YWNARGGSYTDGGAFIFSLKDDGSENKPLVCTDKFGRTIETPRDQVVCDTHQPAAVTGASPSIEDTLSSLFSGKEAAKAIFASVRDQIAQFDPDTFRFAIDAIKQQALKNDDCRETAIEALTLLSDRRYDTGRIKRSSVLHVLQLSLDEILSSVPKITDKTDSRCSRIDFESRAELRAPQKNERVLVIDAGQFEPEGENCDAVMIVKAYQLGWKRFIVHRYRGQRFTGCGFGPATKDVRIDVYGSSGDYLAESFMAGDPLNGGGFVVLNGIGFDERDGSIREYESPYPGSNIFSLASGGAIYVRDPRRKLVDEQLNGGEYMDLTDADWKLILPYLEENERLFGITIEELLTVDGKKRTPAEVYRKIRPKTAAAAVHVEDDDAGLKNCAA
ncbi:MAG: glutamate synthase, partial [Betaproteobacteria bacterium HGW-Betaproteobacteria-18]